MVTITKKIINIGGSRGIILEKEIMERMDLQLGDYIKVIIKKEEFVEGQ